MMSVGGIPSLVMTHLSQAHDEQMGQLLQSNQIGGMGGRSAQAEAAQSASALGFTPLQTTQLAGSVAPAGIPTLHLLSAQRSALQTTSAQSGTGLFGETARHVVEKKRQQERESGTGGGTPEQEMARLIEVEACRTIVQIALMIQRSSMFGNYLVASIYQQSVSGSTAVPRQMIVVAGMDEPGQQIPVHATLIWLDSSGNGVTRRLPGQLIWGQCSFAADWVVMHLQRDSADGFWRLQAEGLRNQLTGVALAAGDIPAFAGSWADASLHLPGAARYWVKL